jgi:hypothetical protein
MKDLTSYINEGKLKSLNLNGIPNRETTSEVDRKKLAKEQEQFTVDRLNESYPEYEWKTLTDYLESIGEKWSSEKDLKLGDIVGLKNNIVKFYIDLKVCGLPKLNLYGPISLNSILNFGESKKFYYLCVNKIGEFIILHSSTIKELFEKKDNCLLKTKQDRKVNPKLIQYKDKFKYPTNDVAGNDFMPSYVFRDYAIK